MHSNKRIGLSLSGGGYRAAAFHLGTLKKLHQLNLLTSIDVLSTISGGSITGAYYCLYKPEGTQEKFEDFEDAMKKALSDKSVLRYILTSCRFVLFALYVIASLSYSIYVLFTPHAWVSLIVMTVLFTLIILFQFKLFPVSKIIEKAYDKYFFSNATLSDFREDRPLLAIGSTNIQTCRPFTFSKIKMSDSAYEYGNPPILFKPAAFPISRAVMASSSVPFAFTPIRIADEYFVDKSLITFANPVLVDGGVYDNQGIQKLTEEKSSYNCDVVITSDAGNRLPFEKSYNNVFVLLIRTMNVFMTRIKNFQMVKNLYSNVQTANKEIAYFSLGWDFDGCLSGFISNLKGKKITQEVITKHKIPTEWIQDIKMHEPNIIQLLKNNVNYAEAEANKLTEADLLIARGVGTNLAGLSLKKVDCLMRHAANLCEIQLKLYCPSLFK